MVTHEKSNLFGNVNTLLSKQRKNLASTKFSLHYYEAEWSKSLRVPAVSNVCD